MLSSGGRRLMPKATFLNLNPQKRRRIFDAAVQEFAAKRFSEASINQIIKAAGIPRGSFYQYFEDKEDLYLYMMAEIGREKMALFSQMEALNPEADFFDTCLYSFRQIIAWSKARPDYGRIAMLMELDDSEFIFKLRALTDAGLDKYREMLEHDKQRGRIKANTDINLVVDMYYALSISLFKEYQKTGSDEMLLRRMSGMFQILKEGIAIDQSQQSQIQVSQEQ
jgi:TetR/AcrR family transcriptional regulator